ncbi:uncharacterized protein LOC105790323 isoform X3 [Gossypium raimondii]|uniref:uncharacterized protein LOC105790323 isoform X3 n=1 Tax=Gossypium raimondii TaxID=29730 RepID=UPI00063AFFF7|nr:uncharacterized protein LOC105790323 isoform X3 [Gossypium raimondii]
MLRLFFISFWLLLPLPFLLSNDGPPSFFEHYFRKELPLLYKYLQEAPAEKLQSLSYCLFLSLIVCRERKSQDQGWFC